LVIALGASAPVAGTLALQRGRLYGWRRHRAVVASLVSEPAVRLSLGVLLCVAGGAVGGAAGVVVAGYAALEVIRRHRRRWQATARTAVPAAGPPIGSGAAWAAGAFALLAVLQNQDLLFANAMLPSPEAGSYAALSTLGGIAAFATVTIPLVMLPRAIRSDRHALRAAVGLAALLGVLAVCASVAAPGALVASLFGGRYARIAPLVVPYLAGMGALGTARVVVAYRCATGAPKLATGLTAAAAAGQACVIALAGSSPASIAWTTVGASGALAVALGVDASVRNAEIHTRLRTVAVSALQPTALAVGGLTAAGLAVRCIIPRGIWLDEATSIHQAGMSFGAMIANLRTTDVHPPLYFSVLWVFEHLFGNGAFAMRVPSILAGSLIVPVAYVAARDLWDRRTGMVCASFATVAPIVVWYSQEARMYSMFMLFAL
ncbi:MAG: glycosyltransferase family 39 protein, partial [Solirubrobacteraceae bacterium]